MAKDNPFDQTRDEPGKLIQSHRPVRNTVENTLDKVPVGPLGFAGEGNLVGGATFFTVSAINGINPIDGLNVGFNTEASSVEKVDGAKVHTFFINAWSEDTARFAAKMQAAPSLIDLGIRETEIISVEEDTPRRTASTWRVMVRTETRKIQEDIEDMRNQGEEMV